MKRLIPFLIFLFPSLAWANTITANSCSQIDVQTALNSATSSTTQVTVPPGACNWSGNLTWNVPSGIGSFTLQGATQVNCTGTAGTSTYACTATDSTVIKDAFQSSGGQSPLIIYMPSGACGSLFRITGLTIQGGTGNAKNNGIVEMHGPCDNLRIDHNHLNMTTYNPAISTFPGRLFAEFEGSIDHNVFDNGINTLSQGFIFSNDIADPTGNGDTPWASATGFGTSAFIFLENNVFNGGMLEDCDTGGKFVARYNSSFNGTPSSSSIHTHGTKSGGFRGRGCRAYEAYKNYIQGPSGTPNNAFIGSGGGPSLVWGNTMTGGYNNFAVVAAPRNDTEINSPTPQSWGYCGTAVNNNGTGSCWDGNSTGTASGCPNSQAGVDATGWPCLDGLGRGQGDALSGNFPSVINSVSGVLSWPRQKLEPIYYFCNALNGANEMVISENSSLLNRDIYIDNASFNGTTGTGCGLAANRPATCTAGPGGAYGTSPTGSFGVAYFATDSNSGNGQLSVCTATNTWSTSAIYPSSGPYTYPHPLDGGTPVAAAPTASPVAGNYNTAQSITLTTATTTGSPVIAYCQSSSPNCSPATTYTGPVLVSGPVTNLCAYTTATGFSQSPTSCFLYNIGSITLVRQIHSANLNCTPVCPAQSVSVTNSGDLLFLGGIDLGDPSLAQATISSVSCSPSIGTWVLPGASCQKWSTAASGVDCGYVLSTTATGSTSCTVTLTATSSLTVLHWREYNTTKSGFALDAGPSSSIVANCSSCTTPNLTLSAGNDVLIAGGESANTFTGVSSPFGNGPIDGTGGVTADNLNTTSGSGAVIAQNVNQGAVLFTIAFTDTASATTCAIPVSVGPNAPGTYISPPTTLPLSVQASSPSSFCGLKYTTSGTANCSSTAYPGGGFNISASQTYSFISCPTSSGTASSAVSMTWTIQTALAAPIFSPAAGTYTTTQSVTLTLPGGSTGCYTTDGSAPTATTPGTCSHGTTYSGAISVSSTETINAIATQSGMINSQPATAKYTIQAASSMTGAVYQ